MFGAVAAKPQAAGIDFFSGGSFVSRRRVLNWPAGVVIDNQVADRLDVNVAGLNVANTFTLGPQTIKTGADANVGITIQGNSATQSSSLEQWQKTAGNTRARITSNGEFSNPNPNDCTGTKNEVFGLQAGANLTTGIDNTFLGCQSGLSMTTGTGNVAVGYTTLQNNVTGVFITAVGFGAVTSSTSCDHATVIGCVAGTNASIDDVMVGYATVQGQSGGFNTAIGTAAGKMVSGTGSASSAAQNTLIGTYAGAGPIGAPYGSTAGVPLTTGVGNTILGSFANTLTAGQNYGIAIGYGAACAANECAISPFTNVQTFYVNSSTSAVRQRADFTLVNVDNTDATRKYRIVHNVWDTAAREAIRCEATGSAALVGIGGAVDTAAVPALLNTNGMAKFTGGIGVPANAYELTGLGGGL